MFLVKLLESTAQAVKEPEMRVSGTIPTIQIYICRCSLPISSAQSGLRHAILPRRLRKLRDAPVGFATFWVYFRFLSLPHNLALKPNHQIVQRGRKITDQKTQK